MSEKIKHTKGKLVAKGRSVASEAGKVVHDRSGIRFVNRFCFEVLTAANQGVTEEEAHSNAARLAHCWNCHDGLVEALKAIAEMTDADNESSYRCDDREGCLDTVFAKAKAAITKAAAK